MAVATHPRQVNARALGIDLVSKEETSLFRWLLACLLFGNPIQQRIAERAYHTLTSAGVTTLGVLTRTSWKQLVAWLDEAHYVRYDFSTATKLLSTAHDIKAQYGSVTGLIEQSRDAKDLEMRLVAHKGIGPVTAGIFMRDVVPLWFGSAN